MIDLEAIEADVEGATSCIIAVTRDGEPGWGLLTGTTLLILPMLPAALTFPDVPALCAELRAHRDALDRIENAMRTLTVGAGSIEMKAKIRGIIEGVRG